MTVTEPSESKRLLQLAEDVRNVIANMFVRGDIADPRVKGITIHSVKLSADLSIAKVYFMIPENSKRAVVEKVLKKVSGYVRKTLSKELLIRHTPEIHFYYDDNIEHAFKIHQLLSNLDKNDK